MIPNAAPKVKELSRRECWKIFRARKNRAQIRSREGGTEVGKSDRCQGNVCGYPAAVGSRNGTRNARGAAKRPANLSLRKVCKRGSEAGNVVNKSNFHKLRDIVLCCLHKIQ